MGRKDNGAYYFSLFLYYLNFSKNITHVFFKICRTCLRECYCPNEISFSTGSSAGAASHHYLSWSPLMRRVVSHLCDFTLPTPLSCSLSPHHLPGNSAWSLKTHLSTSSSGQSFQISQDNLLPSDMLYIPVS